MTSDSEARAGTIATPPEPSPAPPPLFSRAAPGRSLVTMLLLFAVVLVAARSLNYLTPNRPGPDAGVFAAVGMQLLDGKALYRDTMDAKPPVVYLLNAAALSLGDRSFHAVRLLERGVGVAGSLLVFFLVWTVYRRRSLATLAGIGYALLVYSDALLEEGNVTEEYGIVLVLAGILCAVHAARHGGRASLTFATGAGFFFSCAVFTKEPFLFSSVAWFALLVASPWLDRTTGTSGPRERLPVDVPAPPRVRVSAALRRALPFVAGALVPAIAFFGILVLRGSLSFWIERVTGSMGYVASLGGQSPYLARIPAGVAKLAQYVFTGSRTGALAFAAGIVAAVTLPSFARTYRCIPWACAVGFVMDFIGATLSPTLYGHYYLQVIPSYLLCAAGGGAALLDLSERALRRRRRGLAWIGTAAIAIVPFVLDASNLDVHRKLLQAPFVRTAEGPISRFVSEHAEPGDRLWVTKISNSRFYVETALPSPSDFIHYFPGWFTDTRGSTAAQKLARLKTDLETSPPAYVVAGNDTDVLRATGLLDWICAGYTLAPLEDVGFISPAHLYVRNERAAALLPASEPPPRDEACASVLVTRSGEAYQRGDWEASVSACVQALKLDPRSVGAFNNLCVSYIQLRDFDRAVQACEAALAIEPGNELARNNLAWARAEKDKK